MRCLCCSLLIPLLADQGESNIGISDASTNAKDYACTFPALIQGWRREFGDNNNELWFGFVQIAGYSYASSINCTGRDPPDTNASCPDTHHSLGPSSPNPRLAL